jgi:hypothetical protein
MVPDFKICHRCKEPLPRASFYLQDTTTDGLSNWCHACQSAFNKERRQAKQATPEKGKTS